MTRPSKKEGERFFVERDAELLRKKWGLGPHCEHPDFIVMEGARQFGLEVCEIFTGRQMITEQQRSAGYLMRREESETQRAVDVLRRDYESNEHIPLLVKFVGSMCDENMAAVLPALVEMNLSTERVGYQNVIDLDEGHARLRVYVTRALRADWFSVDDRVGSIDCDPIDRIALEVEEKSKNLTRYRECTGLDDIRLPKR